MHPAHLAPSISAGRPVSHFQRLELQVEKQSEVESSPRLASDPIGDSRAAAVLGNPSPQAQPSARSNAGSLISWLSHLWLLFLLIKEEKNDLCLKESQDTEVGSLRS